MGGVDEDEALLRQLEETLAADPNNPSNHFNLAVYLWKRGEADEESGKELSRSLKERAAEHFLASAKLNPRDASSFRFLAHYYIKVSGDAQRASKCYQRAIALNPEDSEAGEEFCDLLDAEGKESLEVAVCKEASEKSPRAFWAFRRLGYLQVYQRKWPEAVQSLQQGIRGYPACADLWEALGLAYHRLGMFTAAIKSYGRAIELGSSRIFALMDSGHIQLMLGSFRNGVEQFRRALEIAPENLSARFGLASGLLNWSKECTSSGAFSWGASLLEEALEVAKALTMFSGNMFSSWKLLGDIQVQFIECNAGGTIIFSFPHGTEASQILPFDVAAELVIALAKCIPWEGGEKRILESEEHFIASIEHWKEACRLSAYSAKSSYQRALHLAPWNSNIYADVAIILDLINFLEDKTKLDPDIWQLPEKMSVGSLMLEGENKEFWVILGCLSGNDALKQHALIRGLQLDVSLSLAWACLGKFYRNLGEKVLGRQAFDRARSIDPSLALPWAGMAADYPENSSNEAYESCLRAVQTLPLAEFQVGLATLAARSGHLMSPQVLGAIRQAVQRAPFLAESHNLFGLICEAREDYHSAIVAYQHARYIFSNIGNSSADTKLHFSLVSINLARSLCKAGYAVKAAHECEDLKKEGFLDHKGMQMYAFALWKVGQSDKALIVATDMANSISTLKPTSAGAALGFLCQLLYNISGSDFLIAKIQEFPYQLVQSTRMAFIFYALNALHSNNQQQLHQPTIPHSNITRNIATEMHSLTAIRRMIQESQQTFIIDNGVNYLRRVLHMYPESSLIRSLLSSLLLSSGDWMAPQKAARCSSVSIGRPLKKGLKVPVEVHAAASIACYASCTTSLKFSFGTCKDQLMHGMGSINSLQRWLHHEPWNQNARYLLVLNLMQKAREEKFPQQLCRILDSLVSDALSLEENQSEDNLSQHRKFMLLLSASEISLQCRDYVGCIDHATKASKLSYADPFFAHLQLCRGYAAHENFVKLNHEYANCLQIKTIHPIGWILLKYIEARYRLHNESSTIDVNFQKCLTKRANSLDNWMAILYLAHAQSFIWDDDFSNAEQVLQRACTIEDVDSCLLLCHGAVCMEIVRQQSGTQFLTHAINSLKKIQDSSPSPLPIVSLMLAQAEASLGSKAKWERNLRLEWFAWPEGMRPPELYFQIHLLARQKSSGSYQDGGVETTQSPEKWILRAIHLNPSCSRYWKVLQKLGDR